MIDLPVHQYVTVSPGVIHDDVQCGVWFAVQPNIGGVWGGHVLLESGALFRNVPLHLLTIDPHAGVTACHEPGDLQLWDCYCEEATAHEYTYLRGLSTLSRWRGKGSEPGRYLFTIVPRGDAFSRHPDQAKEFVVSVLDDTRRLAIRATNEVLFADKSLAVPPTRWPEGLRRLTSVPRVEVVEPFSSSKLSEKKGGFSDNVGP